MVAAQGAKMRKSTLRNTTARVLVLGHQQTGKSAAIVRYTTGRFIQNYCSSTNDWLYRHPLGFDAARNQYKLVELLEQKDIEFSKSLSHEEEQQQSEAERRAASCSLSSRVALDRQIDHEFYEKQQLLNKLHWANAYVVVYALNDTRSFNKAIKYLNLIANEVNRQPASGQHAPAGRPILLVGNKRDLTHSVNTRQTRRVSHSDGRLLAMRHYCLFAELSISEAAAPIVQAITNLVESIRASELHTSRVTAADLNEQPWTQTQLTYWIPISVCQMYGQHNNQHNQTHSNGQQQQHQQQQQQQPVWSALVRTRVPASYSSVSQNIVQSSCIAIKAKRLNEADFRLLTPVGLSLSSGSSSSTSSSPGGSIMGPASGTLVKAQQCQVAQPLLASAAVADIAQTPAMGLIESVSGAQRMVATRPSVSSISSMSSAGAASSSGRSHLSSFRSSFRKGALAIVGSRSLAAQVGGSGENKENARKLSRSTPRSSLSSIQNQDALSSLSHTASDSDTSSSVTIDACRQRSIESDGGKKPPAQRITWIRSKISSLTRQDTLAPSSDASSIGQQSFNEQQQQTASRFRRPLFRYRNRRKTVAFEPTFETNEPPSCGSLVASSKSQSAAEGACLVRVHASIESTSASQAGSLPHPNSTEEPLDECADQTFKVHGNTQHFRGAHSGPPKPTKTATATGVPNEALKSVFIVDGFGAGNFTIQRAASTGVPPASSLVSGIAPTSKTNLNTGDRINSHSTLSRTSTSGGSYDEDSELESDQRVGCATAETKTVAGPVKTRYHLVKTVQSTLTNLARAAGGQTPVASAPTQPVKRSFCNALFSRNNASSPAQAITDRIQFEASSTAASGQMAQVERIQTLPLMAFCK